MFGFACFSITLKKCSRPAGIRKVRRKSCRKMCRKAYRKQGKPEDILHSITTIIILLLSLPVPRKAYGRPTEGPRKAHGRLGKTKVAKKRARQDQSSKEKGTARPK